jgi:hypothetical protein
MWFLALLAVVFSEGVVVVAASETTDGDDTGAGAS